MFFQVDRSMQTTGVPVPNLNTAHTGPLLYVEKIILNQTATIEAWFRNQWQETPPSITSSVDLRHAGYKLAPVDTNLFPAGFNNLNQNFMPLCIQAAQSVMGDFMPCCRKIILIPESHTRNPFYLKSLSVLRNIFVKAGFLIRIGSIDPELSSPVEYQTEEGEVLLIEPLTRTGDKLSLPDFEPCMLLLNNDLSSGVPAILQGIQQSIMPTDKLGWNTRLKSSHFQCYDEVVNDFSAQTGLDPWFINPFFDAVDGVDFMAQEGVDELADRTEKLFAKIRAKYEQHGIGDKPFVVIKADNGTYGMSVMMVQDADELRQMNRKQRTRMSATKGSRKVNRVLIQEGVYTVETMTDGAVAEPVIYMIGQFVVGGFYRVHQGRAKDENLNAPGMHFESLAFTESCNMPEKNLDLIDCHNRLYVYGVIARLAALAAAREIAAVGGIK